MIGRNACDLVVTAAKPEQFAVLAAEAVGCVLAYKTGHRSDPALDIAIIPFGWRRISPSSGAGDLHGRGDVADRQVRFSTPPVRPASAVG